MAGFLEFRAIVDYLAASGEQTASVALLVPGGPTA
jgi:hypothetical protein